MVNTGTQLTLEEFLVVDMLVLGLELTTNQVFEEAELLLIKIYSEAISINL